MTVAMGAVMGTGVGLTIGFIGGAFQILRCDEQRAACWRCLLTSTFDRAGPGPRGTLGTLAQFMGTSAATFGCVESSISLRFCMHADIPVLFRFFM